MFEEYNPLQKKSSKSFQNLEKLQETTLLRENKSKLALSISSNLLSINFSKIYKNFKKNKTVTLIFNKDIIMNSFKLSWTLE